jgi:hypothetical protein
VHEVQCFEALGGAEAGDKVIFESLNGSFSCIWIIEVYCGQLKVNVGLGHM